MARQYTHLFLCFLFALTLCSYAAANPRVLLETNLGQMTIELYPQAAPVTVDNFLFYVNTGFYDSLIFHRVIPNFMIQGGGYYLDGYYITPASPTAGPIINEASNGLKNLRGTIAMARTGQPHSATSQFFINHVDNPHLDPENTQDGYGYCVFGKVVQGIDVVDTIAQVHTIYVSAALANFPDDPPVIISQARVLPRELSYDSNFNADARIDFKDFAVFASNWLENQCASANGFCGGSDLDYSGDVDVIDLELFLRHWNQPVGYEPSASDIASNGTIDLQDLAGLMAHWLDSGCTNSNGFCGGADINRDLKVNLTDFALLSGNWLVIY